MKRQTTAAKRAAVRAALKADDAAAASDREIARRCGVSRGTAAPRWADPGSGFENPAKTASESSG